MSDMFAARDRPQGREGVHLLSTATLPVEDPSAAVDSLIEKAQLHRGSLREQDGFTIPFREGGSCRFRVQQDGLHLTADAPTPEREEYIHRVVGELVEKYLGADQELRWTREGGAERPEA